MDYEKKYKEAIELMKDCIPDADGLVHVRPQDIFHELEESEDEKTKRLLHTIANKMSQHLRDIFTEEEFQCFDAWSNAWLEKQGEQKPKFRVGDWVVYECEDEVITLQIKNIVDGTYEFTDDSTLNVVDENTLRLWTIQDAKPGDVLVAYECLVLFKEIDGLNIRCYCTYHFMNNESFFVDTLQNKTVFTPATKEQRDTLVKAMADAGYTFDFEKKELKKIEQKPTIEMKTPEESLGIDSDTYNKIVDECVYGEQKPATWSEEDELRMENILSVIEGHGYPMEVKWLKSIKGRHTWKPSDEQTEALDGICSYIRNKADWEISQDTIHQLYSLSEQLKKLKG